MPSAKMAANSNDDITFAPRTVFRSNEGLQQSTSTWFSCSRALLYTVLLHRCSDFPIFLESCGFHSFSCLGIPSDGLRRLWPIQRYLRYWFSRLISFCHIMLRSSLFEIKLSQRIRRMLLRNETLYHNFNLLHKDKL